MKNLIKRKWLYSSLLIIIMSAAGCSLAPKEEVLPDAPVIPTSKAEEYKKVDVMRGDIIDSVTVDCTYKAFSMEDLKFSVDGVRISHVFVKEGDRVKAGDVLADLMMSDVSKQLEDHNNNVELLNLEISHEQELKDLAASTQNKLKTMKGYNDQIKNGYDIEITTHNNTIKELKDNLFIERERINQLKEEVRQHQIIAGIDGIVSSIASFKDGDRSNKNISFITIYDPATMVFITNGENSSLFKQGQKVSITVDEVAYQTEVISGEEFTKKASPDLNSGAVYLKAEDKENQLQNGDRGEVTFINNELKNVLYLPSAAVQKENGKSIVYVEDDGGIKSVKEIQTGLEAAGKVQVISGLNEGDSVILD